ncbi:nuclear transport factor 2 family protein [Umezawaea endophytica]|uniref:Nuclear transport factor 2 family protein n=1 Tax=Umezawaea endophytica TaxID=1654476 RepID=A0A9X3A1G3_9PSEU|nr:nuclear transport factor 2 family protein [Umezawaea endophytica]MCS7477973.1 nuclear transport factor 2 family protein [Umezawaea endophytica]
MTLLTLEDRYEITETLSLIGHLFDSGELDRLEDGFTPDAVYDLTDAGVGAFEGIEAMRQGALRLGAHNPVAHHLTNVVITVEDDIVIARSKGFILMAGGKVQSLTHHDVVRRHDGRWRVSRRVIKAQDTPMSGNFPAVEAAARG